MTEEKIDSLLAARTKTAYINDLQDTLSQIGALVGIHEDADGLIKAIEKLAARTGVSSLRSEVADAQILTHDEIADLIGRNTRYLVEEDLIDLCRDVEGRVRTACLTAVKVADAPAEPKPIGYISKGALMFALVQGHGVSTYIQSGRTDEYPVAIYTAPVSADQPAHDASVGNAADYIEQKAESYLQENSRADYDTGATEWRNDECRDHYYTLTELADEIRALRSQPGQENNNG